MPFYLGGGGQQHTFGQTEVTLVIEPGWEEVEEKIINSAASDLFQRNISGCKKGIPFHSAA
jgi:hypothetical protein